MILENYEARGWQKPHSTRTQMLPLGYKFTAACYEFEKLKDKKVLNMYKDASVHAVLFIGNKQSQRIRAGQ